MLANKRIRLGWRESHDVLRQSGGVESQKPMIPMKKTKVDGI